MFGLIFFRVFPPLGLSYLPLLFPSLSFGLAALGFGAHNDKLSCRAVPGFLDLSYSVSNPIELAATRTTAAPC
jgi:hypothetical protein